MRDSQMTDAQVRQRMHGMLDRIRDGILTSHERDRDAVTASLIFSCADTLGPFVDPAGGELSRDRIGTFFEKHMAGFKEEVTEDRREGVLLELHDRYLSSFDHCFFTERDDYSYVEPAAELPDGTEVATVINLDRLLRDFLAAIERVRCDVVTRRDAVELARARLEAAPEPTDTGEGE